MMGSKFRPILRDPPPHRDVLALAIATAVIWVVNPHDMSTRARGLVLGSVFVVLAVVRVLSRGWVRAGPDGVAFGQWFRKARYSWDHVEGFTVGNPERPGVAYVMIQGPESTSSVPVRLPRLYSISAEDLVKELRLRAASWARSKEDRP